MKKLALSLMVIASYAAYAWHARHDDNRVASAVSTSSTTPTPTPSPVTSVSSTPTPTAAAVTGKYKDGAYTGKTRDAFYGNIQVKVTVSGGRISDVVFLQYPNDRRDSIEINRQAMPILKQEAIQAQSADVDGVSGATDTSQAFIESLSSALTSARA
jgi:uncharacterized protein with FMN-binding domain